MHQQEPVLDDPRTYPDIVHFETVRDARASRFLKAAAARNKGLTQQTPSLRHTTGGLNPAHSLQSAGTASATSTSKKPSPLPATVPQEPRLSDSLAAFLTHRAVPPAARKRLDHESTAATTTSSAGTWVSPLPQWLVAEVPSSQLLDAGTVKVMCLNCTSRPDTATYQLGSTSHPRSPPACASLQPPSGTSRGANSARRSSTAAVVYDALQPLQPLLDAGVQDHCAEVYTACEGARDTGHLTLCDQGWRSLPAQVGRFLLSHGRCLSRLDLSRNHLTTCPPLELTPSLTHLDLSHNALPSVMQALGLATQLTCMLLNHNQLAALPDSLGRLTSLTVLDVSHNQLTVLPQGLGHLSGMQQIKVSHNCLHALPATITQLPALAHLDASHNQLTAIPPEWEGWLALTRMDLASNRLTALPICIGACHATLRHLDLSSNHLTVLPRQLALLTSLEQLILTDNPLVLPPPKVAQEGVGAVRLYLSVHAPTVRLAHLLPSQASSVCECDTVIAPSHESHCQHSADSPAPSPHSSAAGCRHVAAQASAQCASQLESIPSQPLSSQQEASVLSGGEASFSSMPDVPGTDPLPPPPSQPVQAAATSTGRAPEILLEMEEQGELLLHLQLERDQLLQQNLLLTRQLRQEQDQRHLVDLEATELRTALQTRAAADRTPADSCVGDTAPQPVDLCTHETGGSDTGGRDSAEQEGLHQSSHSLVQGQDVIQLARRVHQLELRTRTAERESQAHRERCELAEEQLRAETARRVQVEQSTGSLVVAREALAATQQQLKAAEQTTQRLQELLASHLFQQRAAEDRCWEAESKLEALEHGVLGSWCQEVSVLRATTADALAAQTAAQQAAVQAERQLVDITQLLVAQVEVLRRERAVLKEADHLLANIQAEALLLPVIERERKQGHACC